MFEIDVSQLLSTIFAGGGIWLAIRAEIRLLWRDVDRLHKRIDKIESN